MADDDTRVRRDIGSCLTMVEAHAILHQKTRKMDDKGTLIATYKDYEVVRGLVGPLIAHGIEAAVKPSVRKTVEAVAKLSKDGKGVSGRALVEKLKRDKSVISRATQDAIAAGYLQNLSEKGKTASYVLGDTMPSDRSVLPSAEKVRKHRKQRLAELKQKQAKAKAPLQVSKKKGFKKKGFKIKRA